jgi:hypothetical protein
MGVLSKVVLGLGAILGLFALMGWAAGGLKSAFGFPAALAILTVFGGWFLLCCLVSLTFRRHWNEKWKRETMAPVPGVYMPLTRAQREAVEGLVERSDSGAHVRNTPNDTIELLKVERGAVHRYIVSRTGDCTLVEWRPSTWRYACSRWLTLGGWLAVVLGGTAGGLVQEEVVSFPSIAEDKAKTAAAVLFLTGLAALVVAGLLLPDPENYTGPGEWARIGYSVD